MGKGSRMRIALIGAGAVLLPYGLIATGLFLAQRRILFHPDNTPPDLARVGNPNVRPVTVTTADGLTLLAWYLPPAEKDGYVVLHLHGNAGNIGHRAYRLGPLSQLGWGVFLPEYRGFGGNPGSPSESGLLLDAAAALATLRGMGVPPERILLWGESLGSGLAIRLAAEQPVAAILLEAPYTSITDLAQSRFPYVPVRWLLRDRFESIRFIGAVRAPVLVMHGARDQIIPLAMGQAIYAAAPEPKQLWIAPEAGHVDLIEAGAIAAAAAFVSARVAKGSAGAPPQTPQGALPP
jgi:fermentation-respiration switch protein FrsA (DUF1100 family)